MKLEYLYPEIGNLFGDSANLRYLRACLPEAEYVETPLGAEPAFVKDGDVAFLYLGPMTERAQLLALEALRPHASALKARLEAGMHGLFTGNAMELVGKTIVTEAGSVTGLGLVDLEATARKNGCCLIENLCGHGVGNTIHDDPSTICNYYDPLERRVSHG